MIYFFKELPDTRPEIKDWHSFREPEFIRRYNMVFVYLLQFIILVVSIFLGIWNMLSWVVNILVFESVFVIHELLHIFTVFTKGDISLTYHGGIFLWLTLDAVLTKSRYLLYMIFPFFVLTVITGISSFFISGYISHLLTYIAWINAIIAGSDIIDFIIIIFRPRRSVFCRGRYTVKVQKNEK